MRPKDLSKVVPGTPTSTGAQRAGGWKGARCSLGEAVWWGQECLGAAPGPVAAVRA